MTNHIDIFKVETLGEYIEVIASIGRKVQDKSIKKEEENILSTGDKNNEGHGSKNETGKESSDSATPHLWFRGHDNISWNLQPSIYRDIYKELDKKDEEYKDFFEILKTREKNDIETFKVRNYHLIANRLPENRNMWLSLMQHHNAQTRLLDWSEQALTGLFFALEEYFKPEYLAKIKYDLLPCVWAFDPKKFLTKLCDIASNCKISGCTLLPNPCPLRSINNIPNFLSPYFQCKTIENKDLVDFDIAPIPFYPPYNNERVRAQGGTFILFPINDSCCLIESHMQYQKTQFSLQNFPFANQFLFKIIILKPKHISSQLKMLGFKRSLFFPEMPIIAEEIRNKDV